MGTQQFTKALLLLAFSLLVTSESIKPKPGHCPIVFIPPEPAQACVHDGHCRRGEKCCVYSGIAVCTPAIMPDLECPPNDGPGLCAEFCFSDSDCLDNEKCCSNGCGHHCVIAIPVKPGHCRRPLFVPWCKYICHHDGNCPGDKKCCPAICGQVCSDPFLE